MKPRNIDGQKFNLLTVLFEMERLPSSPYRRRFKCRCECGGEAVVGYENLSSGKVASCGCLKNGNPKHRLSHTTEYKALSQARQRCSNPQNQDYHNYGGRGIRVCEEWSSANGFCDFLEHIGPKPSPDMSLDRIDVNGDYTHGNVRWADAKTQANNKRHKHTTQRRTT